MQDFDCPNFSSLKILGKFT